MRFGAALVFLLAAFTANLASAQVSVRGYTRSDGTYVAPHYRSSPNSTTSDNYGTQGNVNPYTGAVGTRAPGPPTSAPPTNLPYIPAVPTASYTARTSGGSQSGPPLPSIITGSDIFEHCGPQASYEAKHICFGYLNGVAASINSLALAGFIKKPFCFSEHLTIGDLATLTASTIQQDRTTWTGASFWVLVDVWTRMAPCAVPDPQ